MAGAVSNLMVRAGFSGEQLTRGLNQMQGELRGAHNTMKSTMGKVGTIVAGAVATAGAALVGMGGYIAKVGISYDAMQESSQVAWTTLLGSTEKAKKQIKDISTFAKNTQFETEGVDAMAKYLNNAGFAGKNLFDELQRVADVSGAFNITADNAQEMVRQMSQVDQATVAYTSDLDVLQNQGIPIYKAIASELGVNVAAVRKMASEGKISSDIYNKAFDSIAKTVQGSADKQSKTWNGMLSTLSDDFKIISGNLMKVPFQYLKDSLDKIMPLIDRFSSTLQDKGLKAAIGEIVGKEQTDKLFAMFDTIKTQGVAAFNMLKSGIKFVIDNFNTLEPIMTMAIATIGAFKVVETIVKIYETWIAVTRMMTAAQIALDVALDANPIGLIVVGIGALVTAGVLLYQNWDTVKNKMQVIWMEIKAGAQDAINGVIDKINEMIGLIDKIPGVKIPLVPQVNLDVLSSVRAAPGTAPKGLGRSGGAMAAFASGTNYAPGGIALVGEQGPELVNLPRGSRVHTASETKQLLNQKAGNTYNLKVVNNQNMSENDLQRMFKRMEMLYQ